MTSLKDDKDHEVQHIQDPGADIRDQAEYEDHKLTPIQALKKHPWAAAWTFYAVVACLLVSFENQAAGMVLGIPKFRQDFGTPYEGDYVLDADWQSAFYGGPIASSVIGTFSAGFVADKIGRKFSLLVAVALSFVAIGVEFAATTNPIFFAGKTINGFTAGIILSVAVSYIGEVSYFTVFTPFSALGSPKLTIPLP